MSDLTILPAAGEIDDRLWAQVADGQPVVLLRDGAPAAVVVDVDSWQEVEALAEVGE